MTRTGRWMAATALCVAALCARLAPAGEPAERTSSDGLVSVAMLSYADGKSSRCFATAFLQLAASRASINVDPEFASVDLASGDLFQHPFVVMTGEGAFELSEREVQQLRNFLSRGGLLLASAGCSNADWIVSFRRAMDRAFPGRPLAEIQPGHEVFSTVFELSNLRTKKRQPALLYGLELDGRLAVVFSPQGLNDTDDAGNGCCCCAGDEVREAKLLNANVLAYALLR